MGEQPLFSAKAHVFQIDPATKRNWVPASKHALTVSFFYDIGRSVYRIICVGGTKAIINTTITPNMTFTRTSQKFGQWADSRANAVYGLGFGTEQQLQQFSEQFKECREAARLIREKTQEKFQLSSSALTITAPQVLKALPQSHAPQYTYIPTPVLSDVGQSPPPLQCINGPEEDKKNADVEKEHVQEDISSEKEHVREDTTSEKEHVREDTSSGKEHVREDTSSGKEHVREDTSSGKEHVREGTTSGKEHVREGTTSGKEHVREGTSSEKEDVREDTSSEKEHVKKILSESSACETNMEAELCTLQENNARLVEALHEATSSIEQWKKQLVEYQEQTEKLREQVSELEAQGGRPASSDKRKEELSQSVEEMEALLKAKDEEINSLQTKKSDFGELEKEREEVNRRMQELEEKNAELEEQVMKAEQTLASSQDERQRVEIEVRKVVEALDLKIFDLSNLRQSLASLLDK